MQTMGQPLLRSLFGKRSVGKTVKGREITKITVIATDINRMTRLYHFRLRDDEDVSCSRGGTERFGFSFLRNDESAVFFVILIRTRSDLLATDSYPPASVQCFAL